MAFKSEGTANIAVFRALKGLGDMLCCVPALRALRNAYPTAGVTLIGLPEGRWVADRFPAYVDRFIDFPGWPGLPERDVDVDSLATFLEAMRVERFDLALQMHGSGTVSNGVIAALNAKNRAGFVPMDVQAPPDGVFMPYPGHRHEVHRCLALAELAGARPDGDSLEFPIEERDWEDAMHAWPGASDAPYACVHPGSSSADRRWPAERFAEVADALALPGLRVVLTGSAAEAEVTRSVARAAREDVVDLAGRTTLGGLAALLRGARCVVCNDTGVSHLAEAVRTPSVVVFPRATAGPPADPNRWAPLDDVLHRVLHECDGRPPCREDIACLPEVRPEDVIHAVQVLLRESAYVA